MGRNLQLVPGLSLVKHWARDPGPQWTSSRTGAKLWVWILEHPASEVSGRSHAVGGALGASVWGTRRWTPSQVNPVSLPRRHLYHRFHFLIILCLMSILSARL